MLQQLLLLTEEEPFSLEILRLRRPTLLGLGQRAAKKKQKVHFSAQKKLLSLLQPT